MRDDLQEWVGDARTRTLDMVRDLTDSQFAVPLLKTINPFLWEIGHVAYFQEYWVLRQAAGRPPIIENSDALYDSAKVAHDTRWSLPLPSRQATIDYLENVRDRVLDRIAEHRLSERDEYFIRLSVFHEDMHDEAFMITRQTLGYAAPQLSSVHRMPPDPRPGADIEIPGGRYKIGSTAGEGFIFDNEKWSHEIELQAFRIAESPVAQSDFAEFVDDGGYERRELWSATGWKWRETERVEHPVYWRRDPEVRWKRRHFNQWLALEKNRPVSNICWFEAEAYCRWSARRLPSEFEWEVAARLSDSLQWGHVWEWTADDFLPYPGFSEDPYKEYSSPWFGTHKTLRGASWCTQPRLMRPAYRNFYTPERRDIWAGLRTCALQS